MAPGGQARDGPHGVWPRYWLTKQTMAFQGMWGEVTGLTGCLNDGYSAPSPGSFWLDLDKISGYVVHWAPYGGSVGGINYALPGDEYDS